MHEEEAKNYDKKDTKVSISELIIITFVTILSGTGFANFLIVSDLNKNKIIYVILTAIIVIVTFASLFIKGYRLLYKYDKRKFDHQIAALKNMKINLKIQFQLALNIKDRKNDIIFTNQIIKKYNDLMSLSPQIRDGTKKKYLEKAEDNDMFNPIITDADGMLQIVIHDDKNIKENGEDNIDSKMKYQIDRWLQNF